MGGIPARYVDGQSTTVRLVTILVASGRVVVTGEDVARDEPLEAVDIPPALGRTPRVVRLSDGASCEVADSHAFAAMLSAGGLPVASISQWEHSWPLALMAVVIVSVSALVGFVYGLPAVADSVAARLPSSALDVLSRHTLRVLDGRLLKPSTLPMFRQRRLVDQFAQMRWPAPAPPMELYFRQSAVLGANAFALPSGIVVVTDDLVTLVADDREILAVLAHEAAHVDHRHGVQSMLQASAVTLLVTWFVGDISILAVAAPTALLQTRYSREFEREADEYAIRALRLNGIALRFFADALGHIARITEGQRSSGEALPYLSTHPATADRLDRLRAAQENDQ